MVSSNTLSISRFLAGGVKRIGPLLESDDSSSRGASLLLRDGGAGCLTLGSGFGEEGGCLGEVTLPMVVSSGTRPRELTLPRADIGTGTCPGELTLLEIPAAGAGGP